MNTDDNLFEIAAREIANRDVVKGIMARAFSEALGDKDKAIALYIKYRVSSLREEQSVLLRKRAEEEQERKKVEAVLLRKKAEEEQELKKAEASHRAKMASNLTTVCKKCGYAGSMNSSLIPPDDDETMPYAPHPFAFTCKCPKCSHRFAWYYATPKV